MTTVVHTLSTIVCIGSPTGHVRNTHTGRILLLSNCHGNGEASPREPSDLHTSILEGITLHVYKCTCTNVSGASLNGHNFSSVGPIALMS